MDVLSRRIAELQEQMAKQQRALSELQESQRLFQTIFAESPIAIELCDAEGRVVSVNRACLEMFGNLEVVKVRWPGVFEDPVVPQPAKAALRRGEVTKYRTSLDFDEYRNARLYEGTRSGIAHLEVLARPLGAKVGRSLTGFLLMTQDVTELKEAENRVTSHQEQLRSLASQLCIVEERERRRLAGDLHDDVGQTLAAIKMKLGVLQHSAFTPQASHQIDDIRGLVEDTIRRLRTLTFDLSPPILYELGLGFALEWLVERFQEKHGVAAELVDDGQPMELDDDVRGLLFRAVSELLMNVAKHAGASKVVVSIRRLPEELHVHVEDNGVGFNATAVPRVAKGFGLFNIRERLKAIGGRLLVDSEIGSGARIMIVAPLSVGSRHMEIIDR